MSLTVASWDGGSSDRAGSTFSANADGSLMLLPLTLTFVGLGMLTSMFPRPTRGDSSGDLLLQALRTVVVSGALTYVLALLSRFHSSPSDGYLFDVEGTLGSGAASSVIGSLLFSVVGLAVGIFLTGPDVLPRRLRQFRATARAPLFAVAGVCPIGVLATLAGLAWSVSTQDEPFAQLAGAVLALPNAALEAVLLTMGMPLTGKGSGSTSVGDVGGSSSDHLTLLTLTEQSAWWWVAPVVLALTLTAAVVVILVRQHSLRDDRREGLRFAAWSAPTALVAALLLCIAGEGNGQLLASDVNGRFSILFTPLVAAFAAVLWGVPAAVIGQQVATHAGSGQVGSDRRRFGAAAPAAPRPTPPQQPCGDQPHEHQPYGQQP